MLLSSCALFCDFSLVQKGIQLLMHEESILAVQRLSFGPPSDIVFSVEMMDNKELLILFFSLQRFIL